MNIHKHTMDTDADSVTITANGAMVTVDATRRGNLAVGIVVDGDTVMRARLTKAEARRLAAALTAIAESL